MKPKTKKILASCALSLPLLASSVLCPILSVKNASADIAPPVQVEEYVIEQSYFSKIGLDAVWVYENSYTSYRSVMPLFPYVVTAMQPNYEYYVQDGSLYYAIEDFPTSSGNTSRLVNCYPDDPSWQDDGGIIDDGVPWVVCTDMFSITAEQPTDVWLELIIDTPTLVDIPTLNGYLHTLRIIDPLLMELDCTYNISYLLQNRNNEWVIEDFEGTFTPLNGYLDELELPYPTSISLVESLRISIPFARMFTSDTFNYQLTFEGEPYNLTVNDRDLPTWEDYLDDNTNVTVTPPPDVGALLWQPVESFLNTEFIPDFTFGDMCLLALGLLLFGVFLKTFLGG